MNWGIYAQGDDLPVKEKETLGEFLKREREIRKISLKDLARTTKIREPFLRAIEEDRPELLPSPVYVKGFLSAYAKSLGLPPQDILLRYEHSLKGESGVSPETKYERPPETTVQKEPSRKPSKNLTWDRMQIGIVVGVLAIGILLSFFLHPYLSGPPIKTSLDTSEQPNVPIPNAIPQAQEISKKIEDEPFSLELRAVEETWVQIQIDDQSRTEALFRSGEGQMYQAIHRIELLIGNAGGLDLIFNGVRLERFGKSGEVVTLVITPRGAEKRTPVQRNSP